jgi:hypothetical protein
VTLRSTFDLEFRFAAGTSSAGAPRNWRAASARSRVAGHLQADGLRDQHNN